MRDLEKALADIDAIRNQIAASTIFRGLGPTTLAATGALALLTAGIQSLWLDRPLETPLAFLGGWVATAVVCAGMIGAEMLVRSRRHHSRMADAMLLAAVGQFLPAAAAGTFLALALASFAPAALWMLPGLWSVLVSLGLFAAARSLPPGIALAGAWYFVAGFTVLVVASKGPTLSPWMMGVPFATGQFLLAALLHRAYGIADGEA